MKNTFAAAFLCLTAALISGCSSRHPGPLYHAGDENPPDFLGAPVTVVLTNLNGFSAHIVSTKTAPGSSPKTTSGDLLGREGRLVFQPTLPIKGKKMQREGGLFFIWDETRDSGYVLSEALQGYAPIKSEIEPPSLLGITNQDIQEIVDGHPCHRYQAAVQLDDGSQRHFTLWEADDVSHFPVRIEGDDGPEHMTWDFSDIRLEYPSQELFSPPDGFTLYASSVNMMNELILRDATLAKKRDFESDEPAVITSKDWHDASSSGTMAPP
jgi:hypothetical protein